MKLKPKDTSYEYGEDCQKSLLEKYRNRHNNHYGIRIELALDLVKRYSIPLLADREKNEIVVLDVGCSIGTFAIEFAKKGYQTYGIDFDPAAISIAKQVATEEGVRPTFLHGDVSELYGNLPLVDIVICFDIFEHLHDDEFGAMLRGLRRCMSKSGTLIFHTFPTRYDIFFFGKYRWLRFPLYPFRLLKPFLFNRVVKIYGKVFDIMLLIGRGKTFLEYIKYAGHCNPTSIERLTDIFKRAGFRILTLESDQLYQFERNVQLTFAAQSIVHRNIFGAIQVKDS